MIPPTMRAVLSERPGPPETLRLARIETPSPGPGEALVRVRAVGLNFFDTLLIEDRYQERPPRPFSPGGELAGEVAALGEGVVGLAVGDRVAAYVGSGAAREYRAVAASALVPVPKGLDDASAAALPIAYGTTLHALVDRAGLRAGETLAVLGAAGGTGLAAVEIGRALGARVIACASSAEKLAVARASGADALVDYSREGLKERLKALTDGAGVDVVYDPVGGDLAEPAVRATAWGGRYLVVGFAGGAVPRIPLNLVLLKGCDLRGVFWGEFVRREPERHAANLRALFSLALEGRVGARIDAVLPLEETAEALRRIAARSVVGKLVLAP